MCTAGREHLTVTEFQEWVAAARPDALPTSIHAAFREEHPDAQGLSALQEATWRVGAKGCPRCPRS